MSGERPVKPPKHDTHGKPLVSPWESCLSWGGPQGGASGRCAQQSHDCPSSGRVRRGGSSGGSGHCLGAAMALDVVTASGTLTVVNVHGLGSRGDSWASKASFCDEATMYAAPKTARGTRPLLAGGGLLCLARLPGTTYHQEVPGAVGAVLIYEGAAFCGRRPSTHSRRTQVGLLFVQRTTGSVGHARTPVPSTGEAS